MPDSLDRIPKVVFEPRDDWCAGCALAQPTWQPPLATRALNKGLKALGPAPSVWAVGMQVEGAIVLAALFDSTDQPIGGWLLEDISCGWVFGPAVSLASNRIGLLYGTSLDAQEFWSVPVSEAATLPLVTAPDVSFTGDFASGFQHEAFSEQLFAANLGARVFITDPTTNVSEFIETLPGALPGSYSRIQVVDDTLFVMRTVGNRRSWNVVKNRQHASFLDDAARTFTDFVTDGRDIIWVEGVQPFQDGNGVTQYARYDLVHSSYADDAAQLQPKTLLSDVPPSLDELVLANGWVVGVYATKGAFEETANLAVRLQDGRAYRSDLPDDYHWGVVSYPTAQGILGVVTQSSTLYAEAIARVPWDAMELVQAQAPN